VTPALPPPGHPILEEETPIPTQEATLSESEEALWFLQQLAPDEGVANLGLALYLDRQLSWWSLQSALQWAARRHPALRSAFITRRGQPVRVMRSPEDIIVKLGVAASSPAALDADLRRRAAAPFDLEAAPLLRADLLNVTRTSSVLLLTIHHLVFDQMSNAALLRDLDMAFASFSESGLPPNVAPAHEATQMMLSDMHEGTAYWQSKLASIDLGEMALGDQINSIHENSFSGSRVTHPLSEQAEQAVLALRRKFHATDNIILLTIGMLLLFRHGIGPDIIFGVPISTRPPGEEDTVGFHFNTVPIVVRPDPEETFSDLLLRVRDTFVDALRYRSISCEAMIRRTLGRNQGWQSPLFRHIFNYWLSTEEIDMFGGAVRRCVRVNNGLSLADLEFIISAHDDGRVLQLVYRDAAYDERTATRMCDHFDKLLRSALESPGIPVSRLSMTSEDDTVVRPVSSTAKSWSGFATVADMVIAQTRACPESVAVSDESAPYSYRDLSRMAEAVRRKLVRAGAGPGAIVGLATGRTAATAAAILATWSLGAAYLPLDPAHPSERLRFQIADAGAIATVVSPRDARPFGNLPLITVTSEALRATDAEQLTLGPDCSPERTAYVIYTSGSTGKPKGVDITHSNLLNLVCHFAESLQFTASDSMTWLTTFSFDISALEVLLPLASGGQVVPVDDNTQRSPRDCIRLIADRDVSVVQATPTTLRMLVDSITSELSGRRVLCGGEQLSATLAKRLLRTGCSLINVYGPTETTIWSTMGELTWADVIAAPAVGRPIANTAIYIIDGSADLCPIGVAGEVAIAGSGVARGYLNMPQLTADRFVELGSMGRVYRTGDLGRWRPDSTLELLGRLDRQVKLRGHRIELGEIESVLESHSLVRQAAVIKSNSGGDDSLLAFVVAYQTVSANDLWRYAADRLPPYSVPSHITELSAMPTNTNGKVDYRAFEALTTSDAATSHGNLGANEEIAAWLLEMWREVLGDHSLNADSNFFLHGCRSVMIVPIARSVNERFGIELPLREFFRAPTPNELAIVIAEYERPPEGTARQAHGPA
jgi:amino acid adenylation domain-containing protein